MSIIVEFFNDYFKHWEITLPEEAVGRGVPGAICQRGWGIRCCFGEDDRGKFMDFYAVNHMTNDRHERIYESGEVKSLIAISDFLDEDWQHVYDTVQEMLPKKYPVLPQWNGDKDDEWGIGKWVFSVETSIAEKNLAMQQPVLNEEISEMEKSDSESYIRKVLEKWADRIIDSEAVAVPLDEEEMNWRLFFAHSQDMRGFRADIFTGGWNEARNAYYPKYLGLRDRWPDSKTMINGLASLWNDEETRTRIIQLTTGPQKGDTTVGPMVAILRSGSAATQTFADALEELQGAKVAFKTRRMIRAYIQNAALLAQHNASFMEYLQSVVPEVVLPAVEILTAERAWRKAIQRDFFHVGPALANYMIADWLLWLWREGQIEWFESYKSDSVFLKTLSDGGRLPLEAVSDFPAYCRSLRLRDFVTGKSWPIRAGYRIPPRVLNEAIWLEEAATNQATLDGKPHTATVEVEHMKWPIRFYRLAAFKKEKELTALGWPLGLGANIYGGDSLGYQRWIDYYQEGFVINARYNSLLQKCFLDLQSV